MLPSSIRTFWSLTQQPSTPLSVLVARATASLIASSKLVSEVALNSVTRATLIASASLHSSLSGLVASLICGRTERKPNIKGRSSAKDTPDANGWPLGWLFPHAPLHLRVGGVHGGHERPHERVPVPLRCLHAEGLLRRVPQGAICAEEGIREHGGVGRAARVLNRPSLAQIAPPLQDLHLKGGPGKLLLELVARVLRGGGKVARLVLLLGHSKPFLGHGQRTAQAPGLVAQGEHLALRLAVLADLLRD